MPIKKVELRKVLRCLALSLTVTVLFVRPGSAQDEPTKGLYRQQPPLTTPEPKIIINNPELRLKAARDASLQFSKELGPLLLAHIEAASNYDVTQFEKINDELDDLYEREDANLLDMQMISEAVRESRELKVGILQQAISRANFYKSASIFYLCFGQPAQSAHYARLAQKIIDLNKDSNIQKLAPAILYWNGAASLWSGDYANCEDHFKRGLGLNAKDSSAGDDTFTIFGPGYVAEALIAQGQVSSAIDWLNSCRKTASDSESRANIDRELALAYTLNKQRKEAGQSVEFAKSELKSGAHFAAVATESLGIVDALAGNYQVAERSLTAALDSLRKSPRDLGSRPEAAQAALWRSYCRSKLKDKSGAEQDREFALSLADECPHVRTLTQELDPLFNYQEKLLPVSDAIPNKWAIVVGISTFSDPQVPRLLYSTKDAKDIQSFLIHDAGFNATHVRTLLDADATGKALIDSLTEWLPSVVHPMTQSSFCLFTWHTVIHDDGSREFSCHL